MSNEWLSELITTSGSIPYTKHISWRHSGVTWVLWKTGRINIGFCQL